MNIKKGDIILPKVEDNNGVDVEANFKGYSEFRKEIVEYLEKGRLLTSFFGVPISFDILEDERSIEDSLGKRYSKLSNLNEILELPRHRIRIVLCPKKMEKRRISYFQRCIRYDFKRKNFFLKDNLFVLHLEDARKLFQVEHSAESFYYNIIKLRFSENKEDVHGYFYLLGNDLLRFLGRKVEKIEDLEDSRNKIFGFAEEDIGSIESLKLDDFSKISRFFEKITSIEAVDESKVSKDSIAISAMDNYLKGETKVEPTVLNQRGREIFDIFERMKNSKNLILEGGRCENFYNNCFNGLFQVFQSLNESYKNMTTICGDSDVRDYILEDPRVSFLKIHKKKLCPDVCFHNMILSFFFAEFKLIRKRETIWEKEGNSTSWKDYKSIGWKKLICDLFELCYLGYLALKKRLNWITKSAFEDEKIDGSIPLFLADVGYSSKYWIFELKCEECNFEKSGVDFFVLPTIFKLKLLDHGDFTVTKDFSRLCLILIRLIENSWKSMDLYCVKEVSQVFTNILSPTHGTASSFDDQPSTRLDEHLKENYELKISDEHIMKFSGGEIISRGVWKYSGLIVEKKNESEEAEQKSFILKVVKEKEILNIDRLQNSNDKTCPCIIRYEKGVYDLKEEFVNILIMEEKVVLSNLLMEVGNHLVNCATKLEELRSFMLTMMKNVIEIHKGGILHMDIKPDNILCDGKEYYLCDFSISYRLDGKEYFETQKKPQGTYSFRSVESLCKSNENNYILSKETDYFSLSRTFDDVFDRLNVKLISKDLVRIWKTL